MTLSEYGYIPFPCFRSPDTQKTKMLPSRLFRNIGLPPPLRSLLIPSASLPSTYQVQLHLRLGVSVPALSAPAAPSRSHYSTTAAASSSSSGAKIPSINASTEDGTTQGTEEKTVFKQALGKVVPKLSITFTCTVEGCGERSTHEFTKHAYEKGIVLVQCPGCKNRYCITLLLKKSVRSTDKPSSSILGIL